jgi:hypothetical protein
MLSITAALVRLDVKLWLLDLAAINPDAPRRSRGSGSSPMHNDLFDW